MAPSSFTLRRGPLGASSVSGLEMHVSDPHPTPGDMSRGSDAWPPLKPPEGSTLDLTHVHRVATEINAAHRAMGTELIAVERHGATVALGWREDLTEAGGGLAPGVLAALLDHVCSLTALLALDDEARFGTTMSLHLDYLEPALSGRSVHARAESIRDTSGVVFVRGSAFHPTSPEHPLVLAVTTVATAT
jgi:acyl-coenzyme A thioesterase PaaI-like protein